jgi:hypothetical protein
MQEFSCKDYIEYVFRAKDKQKNKNIANILLQECKEGMKLNNILKYQK